MIKMINALYFFTFEMPADAKIAKAGIIYITCLILKIPRRGIINVKTIENNKGKKNINNRNIADSFL